MSQQELLKLVVRTLEGVGIEYMLTGSVASGLQGEPRSTHDIDLVVSLQREQIDALVRAFPAPDYYLDRGAVSDAVDRRSMFNLISNAEGDKVDFWMLTEDPFDRSRFARRLARQVFGFRLFVSAPEDTILAKLRWCRMSGGSEKQFVDALRVFELQHAVLDYEYIERFVRNLGVESLWKQLQKSAERI